MITIYVTNNDGSDFVDQHNGVSYTLPTGKTTALPEAVAHHFFGANELEYPAKIARLGWALTSNDYEKGVARIKKYVMSETPPVVRSDHSPAVEQNPVPVPPKRAGAGAYPRAV